jgi:hypothetical protein
LHTRQKDFRPDHYASRQRQQSAGTKAGASLQGIC